MATPHQPKNNLLHKLGNLNLNLPTEKPVTAAPPLRRGLQMNTMAGSKHPAAQPPVVGFHKPAGVAGMPPAIRPPVMGGSTAPQAPMGAVHKLPPPRAVGQAPMRFAAPMSNQHKNVTQLM